MAEKAIRLPEDHPRSIAFHNQTIRRLKQDHWRSKATELLSRLPLELNQRVDIKHFTTKPWMEAKCLEIHPQLGSINRNDEEEKKREESLQRIRQVDAQIVIYTDGLALGGTNMGGAATVVTDGDPEEPNILDTIETKRALFTCSYEEEVAAMRDAAEWIQENCERQTSILVCTDSQSLCMAMQSHNAETDGIREILQNHEGKITIQWIPGHSNIPGNDLADAAAKQASSLLAPTRPITFRSACMQIRKTFKDEIEHPRIKDVYSKYNKETEQLIKSRKEQTTIAQIRSGKHLAFNEYRHELDKSVPKTCPRCAEEDHSLEHWFLRCPGTLEARQDIFGGEEEYGLFLLTKEPAQSLALARRTLLGAGRPSTQ